MREQAYRSIHEWIVNGQLPKGAVTSEVELSRLLDMSRTPVRAALQQLELEGYVRIVPKHGILILDSSSQRVSDLLEMITSLLLFAVNRLWVSQQQDILDGYSQQKKAAYRSLLASGEAANEAFIQYEFELLRDLLLLIHNEEMLHMFRHAADRLFWTHNQDRWNPPHQHAMSQRIGALIDALAEKPEIFRDALFDYLFLLKRTWN